MYFTITNILMMTLKLYLYDNFLCQIENYHLTFKILRNPGFSRFFGNPEKIQTLQKHGNHFKIQGF